MVGVLEEVELAAEVLAEEEVVKEGGADFVV